MTISFCNKHESLALSGNLRGFDRGSTADSAWGGGGSGIQSQGLPPARARFPLPTGPRTHPANSFPTAGGTHGAGAGAARSPQPQLRLLQAPQRAGGVGGFGGGPSLAPSAAPLASAVSVSGTRAMRWCRPSSGCDGRGPIHGGPPRGCRGVRVPPEPPSPDLPALHFLQVLQTGRFSAVWRGTLQQRPVAIKAFVAGAAGRFAAERAVHGLPLMEHDNVARLLGTRGAGPRARGGLLVLQLYPAGSLRHFLEQHVGTWAGSVRLALSLARGLAFLHQELWRDGLYKPSVVHRDLSSQNVLVREDGTCAIGDFGLALALPPRAQAGAGARHAVPIRKAGTQRYLAPEILDESLDLRAWGRALRQADVYALALLLWEILSRCQALSPGAPVPAFRLAYEAELGASPTGAQLRRLAVEERRRPLIPPAWHRAPQPVGALPELLEDCWDPDPEARLSAERALQRLQRLAAGPPPPATGPPQPAATAAAPPGGSGLRTAPPAADREVLELSPAMWDPGAGCPTPHPGVPPLYPPGLDKKAAKKMKKRMKKAQKRHKQRLRLRPPPPPGTRVLLWPPGTTRVLLGAVTIRDHLGPPMSSRVLPVTTHVRPCEAMTTRVHLGPPVSFHDHV
ncbi:anti-Muellerian hormone type-2 receptor [Aquila chrysaetos chrysaetos]|uniref:anti-Muellerian hormone type-2 receptor n=1 Tax=Aquila chrysaetos chrysaetos TaxID=223781 RepID=UPI001B7D2F45|nr:anti-Muellerian hormone type-2 receptor [Aquila chrysaetos chrysaetos]